MSSFFSTFKRIFCKQTTETQRSVASDLGLHCLSMSHKKDGRLIWVTLYQAGF